MNFIKYAKIYKKFHIKSFLASALKNEADKLASKYPQTIPVVIDILRSQDELEKLIKNHQIVIR